MDQLFTYEHVTAAVTAAVEPLHVGPARGPFFVGVDLGQARDHTAIVVVERTTDTIRHVARPRPPFILPEGWPAEDAGATSRGEAFHVRHVERVPLGTPYPAIVAHVAALLRAPPLCGRASVAVDATGVGRPVVDLFHVAGLYPARVTITGGAAATETGGDYRVPKRDLVSALQVLLQEGRLKVSEELPSRAALVDELLSFRATIDATTAHDSYGAHGAGAHDDLVLALALALWHARTNAGGVGHVVSPSEPWIEDDEESADWLWPVSAVDRGSSRYLPGARGASPTGRRFG